MSPRDIIARPRAPRPVEWINARGDWTLFRRGLMRYWVFGWMIIGGPCVSALLFLAVFTLAGGRGTTAIGELTLVGFIAPGIIIFALCQSAFENAAMSLMEDKQEGIIADLLVAPLRASEIMMGYLLPGATSALVTAGIVGLLSLLFVAYSPASLSIGLAYAAATALLFALLGALSALWAERWENYAFAETFMVLPLALLSGAFFPLSVLPEAARLAVLANPVFHGVNGLRYGLTGHQEVDLATGALYLAAINGALFLLLWRLFRQGYKIKF